MWDYTLTETAYLYTPLAFYINLNFMLNLSIDIVGGCYWTFVPLPNVVLCINPLYAFTITLPL